MTRDELTREIQRAVAFYCGSHSSMAAAEAALLAIEAAARDALPRALDTIEAQAATIAERDAEIALLEAKTAELRQALWPFAFEAGMWADHVPDDGRPTVLEIGKTDAENYGSPAQYSIGDLRRARAALAKEPQT